MNRFVNRFSWRRCTAAFAAVAVAVLLLLGAAAPARAQIGAAAGLLPFRIKVGVLLPQDSDTRDFAGSVLYGAEADLAVPLPGAGQSTFSAGYFQGKRNGRTFRVIPLTVSQVFSAPNPAAALTGNVYYGLGAGAYLLRASGNGESRSKTAFGGFGLLGYQLPRVGYFIEGKYHIAGSVEGLSPTGLTVTLGRRF